MSTERAELPIPHFGLILDNSDTSDSDDWFSDEDAEVSFHTPPGVDDEGDDDYDDDNELSENDNDADETNDEDNEPEPARQVVQH